MVIPIKHVAFANGVHCVYIDRELVVTLENAERQVNLELMWVLFIITIIVIINNNYYYYLLRFSQWQVKASWEVLKPDKDVQLLTRWAPVRHVCSQGTAEKVRILFSKTNISHLPCLDKVYPTTCEVGTRSQITMIVHDPGTLPQSYSPLGLLVFTYSSCKLMVAEGQKRQIKETQDR